MAPKPVHGHHHAHHHAHHAQHQQNAHQGPKAHKSGEKPTPAAQPAQAAQATPPQAGAAAPAQPPALKDNFTPPAATPVNLTPGATGERKAPPSAFTGAPAAATGTTAPATATGTTAPAAATGTSAPATATGTGAPATPTAGTPAAATPTPQTKPTISEKTQLQWINQLAPTGAPTDYNGLMYCGPAAGAMIARAVGYEPQPKISDAGLVQCLAQYGQTDPTTGTTGNGMIAMYQEMGLETAASKGADMDWINTELTAGHYVTALGDYYQVPGRIDGDQTAGHYLDITGYKEATPGQEARYVVSDPADGNLNWMTASQLQSFITSAPQGGFAISAWSATAVG